MGLHVAGPHTTEVASMRFFICNNPVNLTNFLAGFACTATVEAEYGDACVEGNILTLAHHGPRKHNPCPCLMDNIEAHIDAVGLSHLDLDALGGCMALLAAKCDGELEREFWRTAAFVDINGVHKLPNYLPWPEVMELLNAWWAWHEDNTVYAPRDGTVLDVTDQVVRAMNTVHDLLGTLSLGDGTRRTALIETGRDWAQGEFALEQVSFMADARGGQYIVVARKADKFVNHLYVSESKKIVYAAVVALNTKHNSITVSVADPIPGFSCCKFMQHMYGELAGGHDSIAGSPRGQVMTEDDLNNVTIMLVQHFDRLCKGTGVPL